MSFEDHGITGRVSTKDGKKFFDFPTKHADDIINVPILIHDFETDIKTSHGTGRYVIKLSAYDQVYKLTTNSFTLKTQLDEAVVKKLLPSERGFPTIMRKRDLGCGKKDYYFE